MLKISTALTRTELKLNLSMEVMNKWILRATPRCRVRTTTTTPLTTTTTTTPLTTTMPPLLGLSPAEQAAHFSMKGLMTTTLMMKTDGGPIKSGCKHAHSAALHAHGAIGAASAQR